MNKMVEVSSLLIDIEAQLRQLNLWQTEPPSAEALLSDQPFAIDTLTFPQWLQFVFLAKMPILIEQQNLPASCSIHPMAEEYFKREALSVKPLLEAIAKLDDVLSS
jgi:uncharacterized protein YqcC (DUF446 family)